MWYLLGKHCTWLLTRPAQRKNNHIVYTVIQQETSKIQASFATVQCNALECPRSFHVPWIQTNKGSFQTSWNRLLSGYLLCVCSTFAQWAVALSLLFRKACF